MHLSRLTPKQKCYELEVELFMADIVSYKRDGRLLPL